MQVPVAMKARVEQKITDTLNKAHQVYGARLKGFARPSVIYKKRGTTAGSASPKRWEINLNATLLIENDQTFLDRTVPHEIAHLIQYKLFKHTLEPTHGRKRSIHGREWKGIMVRLGLDPSRCHSYDTTNSKVRKTRRSPLQGFGSNRQVASHKWVCTVCGHVMMLKNRRHDMQTAHVARQGGTRYVERNSGCDFTHTYEYWKDGVKPGATPAVDPHRASNELIAAFVRKEKKEEAARARAAARRAARPAPVNPKLSKKERALNLVRQQLSVGTPRKTIIHIMVTQLDMTPAGASTYYQNSKKALGK